MINTLGSALIVILTWAAVLVIIVDVARGCPYMSSGSIRRWLIIIAALSLFGIWWHGPELLSGVIGLAWILGLLRAYRMALRREAAKARDSHESIR